jgi:flagellar basal-body rod protein FlgF
MLTELARQDSIAGDLANASTPGYKPQDVSQASFGDVLQAAGATGHALDLVGYGARISGTTVDLTQGPLALYGNGFLKVQTPGGALYTRDGQLAVDAQGRLTTALGEPVLDQSGRTIDVGAHGSDLAIGTDGTITAGGKTLGQIGVFSLTSPAKVGANLFSGTPGGKPAGTTLHQGSLEGSGVNPVTTMVDMIVSLRAYESSQRAIHSIDETLQRSIDSAGQVTG